MQKIIFSLVCVIISITTTFAATIQRGNLLIDLDTGEITIVNTNSQYQSLISDSNTINTDSTTGTSSDTIDSDTTPTDTSSGTAVVTDSSSPVITTSPLAQAITRGYTHGVTKFNNEADFQGDNAILRSETAKMLIQAIDAFDARRTIDILPNCTFTDLAGTPADLLGFINEICSQAVMVGSAGQFRPLGTLTQAEAVTLIARLANRGDLTTTSAGARREIYRDYAVSNKLIKNTSLSYNTINEKVSRGDIMIMLSNIAQSQGQMIESTTSPSTTVTPTIPTTSSSTVSIGEGIANDHEFTTALLWMYQAGMTQYPDPENYNPYDLITREQSAKLFAIYDKKFDTHTTTGATCALTDIGSSTMKDSINAVCLAGIMRGDGKIFRPTATITKAEFMAAILNMIAESPSTTTTARQTATYNKALSLELVSQSDMATFDRALSRYEAALLLYKLYIKNRFITSLTNANTSHNIISSVPQEQNSTGTDQQKVFIDVNTIDNKDFTNGFIDILGTNYALVKKQVSQYLPTSYIRYGDIKSITDDTNIGSISFTIGQQGLSKSILEGYISFDDNRIFTITASDQTPYYIITKLR